MPDKGKKRTTRGKTRINQKERGHFPGKTGLRADWIEFRAMASR